jgi:hypothetical protein
MLTRVILATSLLLTAGCHLGGAGVSGVTVAPGDPAKTAVLQPIAGAAVTVRCGKEAFGPTASTDGQGRFQISVESRFKRSCTIDVKKDGFDSATIPLDSVCPRHEDEPASEYCGLLTIVVVQLHAIR